MTCKSFSVCWLRNSGSVLTIVSLSRPNYAKAVHSITKSVKSFLSNSMRGMKSLLNNEIAGLAGSSERFSGKRLAKFPCCAHAECFVYQLQWALRVVPQGTDVF